MNQYLKNLVKIFGVGGTLVALPLFAGFAGLQPPTPPAMEYVSACLILVAALFAWEWGRRAKMTSRRWLNVAGILLTLVGIGGYLMIYSLFVEPIPGTSERIVRGYQCTRDALAVYADSCPEVSREALADAEWETREIWTRSSVTAIEMALVGAWFTFTIGLMIAIGSIVAGRKF